MSRKYPQFILRKLKRNQPVLPCLWEAGRKYLFTHARFEGKKPHKILSVKYSLERNPRAKSR